VTDPRQAYRRYGPALLRKCERMLGSSDDAQDLVQGLFTDLLAGPERPLELPYLYRAVTNRALNLIRDRGRRRKLLERQQVSLRPPPRLTDEAVIQQDLLHRLLRRLDERSGEILVYRCCDEMTQNEIAALLSISRKTVGKRLGRIRAELEALRAESQRGEAP